MPNTHVPAAGEAMPAAKTPILTEEPPFRRVCDMENPLATIRDLLAALAFIAETLDDDAGPVVRRLAWLGLRECKAAEKLRGELFHLTHPRREQFEKEGWPGATPDEMIIRPGVTAEEDGR